MLDGGLSAIRSLDSRIANPAAGSTSARTNTSTWLSSNSRNVSSLSGAYWMIMKMKLTKPKTVSFLKILLAQDRRTARLEKGVVCEPRLEPVGQVLEDQRHEHQGHDNLAQHDIDSHQASGAGL